MKAAILLLAAFQPVPTGLVVDRVAVIETNVCWPLDCEECEKPFLTQLIFWDDQERVIDWRIKKTRMDVEREGGEWVVTWHDGETFRQVRAPHFRDRHTGYDVEMEHRKQREDNWRKKLSKPGRIQ
jgi:hypothetical protein